MERKFRKWIKMFEKKVIKHLPNLSESYSKLDDEGKSMINDFGMTFGEFIETEAQHHAQMDRIEKKLNYLIEKIG